MSKDFTRTLDQTGGLRPAARLVQIHLDPLMLLFLVTIIGYGLIVLYSAVNRDETYFTAQLVRMGLALAALIIAAQLNPAIYFRWTPVFYIAGVVLLALVLVMGVQAKGAQRWLELPGLPRFQPSEISKLAVPMMVAWYFHDRRLPPSFKDLAVAMLIILIPAGFIVVQPDLGTAILVAAAGFAVLLLAGLPWRWILYAGLALAAAAPGLWYTLKEYQKQRILTLFDPQSDPLGAGWNTIQATTAIGSGGVYGKGLFEGTQSQLNFLPESHTDFIIAVIGEELGLIGVAAFILLYLMVLGRGLYMASAAHQTYSRLLIGGLTLVFFVYVFVNISMVSGLLPVVGVPLPLVSYGGTSAITLMASFGIVMSLHTHKTW
ncbi:MAG: rod shape-determining protein RodA [Proteobacteria bacterium]|nr:rod shape-determining protein RodA [Pseudomonadota bacterium]